MTQSLVEHYRKQYTSYLHNYNNKFPQQLNEFVAGCNLDLRKIHDYVTALTGGTVKRWFSKDHPPVPTGMVYPQEAIRLRNKYANQLFQKRLEKYKRLKQPLITRDKYSKLSDEEYHLLCGLVYWDLLTELWAMTLTNYNVLFVEPPILGKKVQINYKALCEITSLNNGFPKLSPAQVTIRSALIKLQSNHTFIDKCSDDKEAVDLLINNFLFSDNNANHFFYENVQEWKELAGITNEYIAKRKCTVELERGNQIKAEVKAYLQSLRQILLETQPETVNSDVGRAVKLLNSDKIGALFQTGTNDESMFDQLL